MKGLWFVLSTPVTALLIVVNVTPQVLATAAIAIWRAIDDIWAIWLWPLAFVSMFSWGAAVDSFRWQRSLNRRRGRVMVVTRG